MSEAAPLLTPLLSRPVPEPPARETEAAVDAMFVERRSTRAFSSTAVAPEVLRSVLEAARWSPSSANGQPWLFVTASTPSARARLLEGLMEPNQRWARHAPVLIYLFTRPRWDGGPNDHADFDAGAAWMSLALQAHRLGLSAHAMGGVHRDRMAALAGVDPATYRPVIAIALGYPLPPDQMPVEMRERERPSTRRSLREIVRSLDDPEPTPLAGPVFP